MFNLNIIPIIVVLLAPMSASAATVSIDFLDESQGQVVGGVYASNTGDLIIKSNNPINAIVQSTLGLGVGDDNLINTGEILILNFDQEISNLFLSFSTQKLPNGFSEESEYSSTQSIVGFLFFNPENPLEISNTLLGLSNDLTLISASWGYETPTVPLPAALPLYAAGMGLMGFLGWRKRRKIL